VDDDDETTQERRVRRPRAPTDSERRRHYRTYPPGVPVVEEIVAPMTRDRDIESARERRKRSKSYPLGVEPVPQHDERQGEEVGDVTAPMAMLLERPLPADADEKIRRLRRESPDPYELAFRIAEDLTTLKRKQRTESQGHNDAFFALIDVQPDEFKGMVQNYRAIRRIAAWMAGGLVTAIGVALLAIWNRSASETSARKDLEFALQRINKLETYIYPERAPYPAFAPAAPPLPTTKGP